jgi:DNA repair ATPase RecN
MKRLLSQIQLKSSSFCTKTLKAAVTLWKQQPQSLQAYNQPHLYRSCRSLTMDRFLTCLCEKDYSALIISGNPTKDELSAAWFFIICEYNELKNIDITENENWDISKELIRLYNHLHLFQQCVDFLSYRYSASIAQSFRTLGYRLVIETENPVPADYMQQLYEAVQVSKTKLIEVQQYEKQLNDFVKSQSHIEPEYSTFEKRITAIEEMQHAVYDLSKLTVSKFIALENKHRDMITALELKAQLK